MQREGVGASAHADLRVMLICGRYGPCSHTGNLATRAKYPIIHICYLEWIFHREAVNDHSASDFLLLVLLGGLLDFWRLGGLTLVFLRLGGLLLSLASHFGAVVFFRLRIMTLRSSFCLSTSSWAAGWAFDAAARGLFRDLS